MQDKIFKKKKKNKDDEQKTVTYIIATYPTISDHFKYDWSKYTN